MWFSVTKAPVRRIDLDQARAGSQGSERRSCRAIGFREGVAGGTESIAASAAPKSMRASLFRGMLEWVVCSRCALLEQHHPHPTLPSP
jgi:hypothetical protein